MIKWIISITLMWASLICTAQTRDTFSVYFDLDESFIQANQKVEIRNAAVALKQQPNNRIHIIGYTDYLASSDYNLQLSERRAAAVKNALIIIGVKRSKIDSSFGVGELPSNVIYKKGIRAHRRVDMVVYQPKIMPTKSGAKPHANYQEIDLKKVEVGKKIVLQNVNFIGGRHIPYKESIPHLIHIKDVLVANPTVEVMILGHICCKSTPGDGRDHDTNLNNLSWARAKFVRDFLVKNGVADYRIQFKGMARTQPLYPLEKNSTEEKLNRRIEVVVLKK